MDIIPGLMYSIQSELWDTVLDFYSQGGTFTNINTFTHYICDDMTLGSGGLGVVLGFDGRISAKTGSFNLNISGTAA